VGISAVIAKLAGIVDQIGADTVVIDVGGVGYLAFCSARTLRRLPAEGAAVRLFIETHVRDDHIHLYGFFDTAERDWFRLLTTVQGVGPRLAMALLSAASADELALAVMAQDKAALTSAEGVGARLAARIVNELKDKIDGVAAPAVPAAGMPTAPPFDHGAAADAVAALENLGVGRSEAQGAIAAASRRLGSEAAADLLIKGGLEELAR
jgi:holliday junction DNA helicase RuvA